MPYSDPHDSYGDYGDYDDSETHVDDPLGLYNEYQEPVDNYGDYEDASMTQDSYASILSSYSNNGYTNNIADNYSD